jgi:hypothetical protein
MIQCFLDCGSARPTISASQYAAKNGKGVSARGVCANVVRNRMIA